MNTPDTIKLYLKAKTAESLKKMMLENNVKTNTYSNYTIIFADGFWYAWYEGSVDTELRNEYVNVANDKRPRVGKV